MSIQKWINFLAINFYGKLPLIGSFIVKIGDLAKLANWVGPLYSLISRTSSRDLQSAICQNRWFGPSPWHLKNQTNEKCAFWHFPVLSHVNMKINVFCFVKNLQKCSRTRPILYYFHFFEFAKIFRKFSIFLVTYQKTKNDILGLMGNFCKNN